jgi:acyl dehydratase
MQTLAALEKGHEFPPTEFELSAEWVDAYVAAVEDGAIASCGPDAVPPMAIAALSIRALLERAGLPPGAIHIGQELAFSRTVGRGQRLSVSARVASRGERAGWVLMGVDLSVLAGQDAVMSGRAVVTFPVGEAQ